LLCKIGAKNFEFSNIIDTVQEYNERKSKKKQLYTGMGVKHLKNQAKNRLKMRVKWNNNASKME
jgi:hypothetical protein